MNLFKTTKEHKKYWQTRCIDWQKHYGDTWNHPHRYYITAVLKTFSWYSLMEIGCGAGANLINIIRAMPGRQLGGIDINKEAIDLVNKTFKGGVFKVNSADDIMMSDNSADIILSDMTLIYVGPFKIKKYLKEIIRVGRNKLVLCEFYSEKWWRRLVLRLYSGYNSYNYPRLLIKLGFYDTVVYSFPESAWPNIDWKQKEFTHLIVTKLPKI